MNECYVIDPKPIIDTDNVFLKAEYCLTLPVLPNLEVYSKTCLTEILEKIDYTFATATNTLNFKTVVLPYLRKVNTITNLKNFSESVDIYLSSLNTGLDIVKGKLENTDDLLLNLRNNFNIANYPKILDTTNIGVTIHDNLKSVLQKIVDNIKSNDTPETLINTIESSSIKLLVSGLNSHTLLASVKLSSVPGNVLASYSDGLFSPGYTPIYQNLDLTNNVLSISNGNYITLPSSGMQTIRLSPGNILTLSGNDSSVTLPSFDETPVTVNSTPTLTLVVGGSNGHTITGNARISPSLNNQLTDSDGLYVSIGAAEVLSKISSDANLYNNVFLDLVSGVRLYNYRWSITNTTTTTKEITYNNQYGVVTTVNVDAASSIFIVGYKITDFDAGLQINFLGQS